MTQTYLGKFSQQNIFESNNRPYFDVDYITQFMIRSDKDLDRALDLLYKKKDYMYDISFDMYKADIDILKQ